MKFSTAAAATALVATTASALRIETPPSLVQCRPVAIQFGDGQAPYFVSVIPNGDTSAVPLVSFPSADSGPITWTVNVTAGTNIGFAVVDGSGNPAYSTPMAVQSSSDTSCLNSASGGGSASASGSSPASSGSAASGSASPSGSGTAAAGSSAPAETSNAAGVKAQGGIYAVLGLVAAACGVVF